MPPLGHHLRPRAIGLYKELHRLGVSTLCAYKVKFEIFADNFIDSYIVEQKRDYPDPNYDFIGKLRSM
jgi:hypothetical protein